MQILQEDTIVGDVMRKFENRNKAADTIVVLQEKKKVITGVMDGQGYVRRLSNTPRKKDPEDVNRSRLNTWMCGMCGKRFQTHIPNEDYDGNAICGDCSRQLDDS